MIGMQQLTHVVYATARGLAWLGGIVLAAMAIMSVVSITGRALTRFGLGPVPGDFELVEAGTALAVFCFLPWCHLKRAHAVVDMFWYHFPVPMRRVLEVIGDALMLAVWVLLTWRMGDAMLAYRSNGETTFILQMPVWWGYAACMPAAIVGCAAYLLRTLETLGLSKPPHGFEVLSGGGH